MKKAGFLVIPLLLLIFSAHSSFADNVQTGNVVDAQSTVENNVQGSGSVTTHIETSANGQTNVIDTNGNGTVNVTNNNGNVSITKTPDVNITQTQVETQISTPTPKITPPIIHKPSLMSNIFTNITDFIKRVFRDL